IDRSGLDDEIADIGTVVQLTTREPGNSLTSPKDILHEIFEIELPPNDEGGGGGSPVSFIDQDKQRRDALKSAMKLALDAIKNRATCRAAISGPARYGRYPDQLLQKLANANQIIFGDGSKTANVGLEAVIQLDKDLFIHHSLPLSMWISHLTTDLAIAQAVELLHELSHATGGTTHEGFTPRFSSTVKLTPRELNERIFNACFGPQPNRAIGRKDED
ncbi:MAG: hypothetical protein KF868_05595, partial [Acidobacteria bacterium]|nr:hypothetical protein [Acidobacteriota bacterium]